MTNQVSRPHSMQEVDRVFPKKILKHSATELLERPFGNDDILIALKLCGWDKAPWPDGFTLTFFLDNWELAKHIVLKA